MYTQCPECQTIFEIDEEALQTSLGIVHCGRCFKRFDALKTLSDTLPDENEAPLAEHDPAENAPILTEAIEARPAAGKRKRRQHAAITVTRPPVALESPATEAPPVAPSRPILDASGNTPDDLFAEPVIAPSRTKADGAPLIQDWRTIDLGDVVDPPRLDDDTGGAPADTTLDNASDSAPPHMHVGAHVYVPPRQRVGIAGFAWVAVLLLLALLLAAQLAWIGRVQLLRDPSTHAMVVRACALIDCRLPLIADAAQLELLSRDVRPDPATPGALIITATMRNNAAFRQPWPIVTVTLTDLENHAVAMRRFRPGEYMADPARRAAGVAPGATAAVAFEVADPGQNAVAFQFAFE